MPEPWRWRVESRAAASAASGADTDDVLADVLQLSAAEIGRLHDDGVVAGAAGAP